MNTNQTKLLQIAFEIGSLARQLNPKNQSYVLNTINALLFSQQTKVLIIEDPIIVYGKVDIKSIV